MSAAGNFSADISELVGREGLWCSFLVIFGQYQPEQFDCVPLIKEMYGTVSQFKFSRPLTLPIHTTPLPSLLP